MSTIHSNFYRMTPQIMVEYRNKPYIETSVDAVQPSKYYIYEGKDNTIYYTESPRYTTDTGYDRFKNQSLYQKYPADLSRSEYIWNKSNEMTVASYLTLLEKSMENNSIINKQQTHIVSGSNPINFQYDSINVYFLRGFNLDTLDGFELRVKTKAVTKVDDAGHIYLEDKEFTILDMYVDKSMLTNESYHLLSTPIYMNSKYYDRYITVEFPSLYHIALKHNAYISARPKTNNAITNFMPDEAEKYPFYILNGDEKDYFVISDSSAVIIEFATISEGNSRNESATMTGTSYKKFTFTLDAIDEAAVNLEPNTDYFNVNIYEDIPNKEIVYYPTYGTTEHCVELSGSMMTQIAVGAVPVVANGFYDLGTVDNFNAIDRGSEKIYYADSDASLNKWKVYNDMNVGYIYRKRVATGGDDDEFVAYEQSFSRIIEYPDNGTSDSTKFWRTSFTPKPNDIDGAYPFKICLKYTCRLVNELLGVEAIRIATLFVDPDNYKSTDINANLNINTYKIVNKINRTNPVQIAQQEVVKEKFIRSYYNMTSLAAKNIGTGGNVYPQGQMTLSLYRTNNNYAIQLFNINADNIRIPYDLTGPYRYKMVFTGKDATPVTIKPNTDSLQQNLGIGTLVFYITSDLVTLIMNMPDDSRRFAIMTDAGSSSALETTLYEGLVDLIS